MAIDDFVANAAVSIISNRQDVWNALVNPDAIRHYMFGAEVKSDWRVGSEISWKGKLNGTQYEDKGVILKIEPQKILKYSQFYSYPDSPIFQITTTSSRSTSPMVQTRLKFRLR